MLAVGVVGVIKVGGTSVSGLSSAQKYFS